MGVPDPVALWMMPDFAATPPLWTTDGSEIADLPLSDALLRRLGWWVEEWERLMKLPPSDRYPEHWRARGEVFLEQVQHELGPSYVIKRKDWL